MIDHQFSSLSLSLASDGVKRHDVMNADAPSKLVCGAIQLLYNSQARIDGREDVPIDIEAVQNLLEQHNLRAISSAG